jgi:DNA polymerase III alpha subunit
MGGDSAYQAWFKAHHTSKFYEVAINHYQNKNNKHKIDALVKEAVTYFNYTLGNYEFGKDNRRVVVDESTNTIYPNLSSIKGFGEQVSQTLYELGQREYIDFVDFLRKEQGKGINKTILSNLIKINYFKMFGEVNYLLDIVKYYEAFDGIKEISKQKILDLGLSVEFILPYGHETPKKINQIDSEKLLQDIINNIPDNPISLKQILDNQQNILGIITKKDESYSNRIFYVSEVESLKSITNINVYSIKTGKYQTLKMYGNHSIK